MVQGFDKHATVSQITGSNRNLLFDRQLVTYQLSVAAGINPRTRVSRVGPGLARDLFSPILINPCFTQVQKNQFSLRIQGQHIPLLANPNQTRLGVSPRRGQLVIVRP